MTLSSTAVACRADRRLIASSTLARRCGSRDTVRGRGRCGLGGLIRQAGDLVAETAPRSPHDVDRGSDGDLEHERLWVGVPGHHGALLPDDGQGVLECILRCFLLPDDAPDRAHHPPLERLDEVVVVEFPAVHLGRHGR